MLAHRHGACVIFALLSSIACAKTQTANNAAQASPKVTPSLVTPLPPSPNPYVTYLALDYDKPGQPTLTANEIAQIREALALVKPCQRRLVRYAFPAWSNVRFILFFQDNPHGAISHPFGQPGGVVYEQEEGSLHATPYDSNAPPPGDIHYDIAHTPCSP